MQNAIRKPIPIRKMRRDTETENRSESARCAGTRKPIRIRKMRRDTEADPNPHNAPGHGNRKPNQIRMMRRDPEAENLSTSARCAGTRNSEAEPHPIQIRYCALYSDRAEQRLDSCSMTHN